MISTEASMIQKDGVQAIRRFNRFYTSHVGLLNEKLMCGPCSLAELRVLFEIQSHSNAISSRISKVLGLDPGYLSRILTGLKQKGLIKKRKTTTDGRQSVLSLTDEGLSVFSALNEKQNKEVDALLKTLPLVKQKRLLHAMQEIESVFAEEQNRGSTVILRRHKPGDLGYIVHRHGVTYRQEYGYNEEFEAMVAQIASDFLLNFDEKTECCLIAESGSEIVGSVALKRRSSSHSILRFLLVEPSARGLGLGKRLLAECIEFARQVGYKQITLSTHSELHSARHLYQQAGFQIIEEKAVNAYGRTGLTEETWLLRLGKR